MISEIVRELDSRLRGNDMLHGNDMLRGNDTLREYVSVWHGHNRALQQVLRNRERFNHSLLPIAYNL